MCCFSQPIAYVAQTKIFARPLEDGRQALVYSMRFAAAGDVAMILPLPVPPSSPEDAVRFVSLEGYPEFFTDLRKAFPVHMLIPRGGGRSLQASNHAPLELVVHDVGDFEASFVPTIADFERLDARFKLAPEVWAELPRYADFGFAVFKLKPPKPGFWGKLFGRPGRKQTVHPMAFEFPRRDPDTLFFPTVHVHDGEVHETARFDHTLYCQTDALRRKLAPGWKRSNGDLGAHVAAERTSGLVDGAQPGFQRILTGTHPNEDITLPA